MQFSLRFTLGLLVALAICIAQTAVCWPPTAQESRPLALWAGTIVASAVWIIFATARRRLSQRRQRRVGIALVALGSLGCHWGLVLFAFAGFNLWAAVPADAIADARNRAVLLIVPCGLLLVSAIASVWIASNQAAAGQRPADHLDDRRRDSRCTVGAFWVGLILFGMPIAGIVLGCFGRQRLD